MKYIVVVSIESIITIAFVLSILQDRMLLSDVIHTLIWIRSFAWWMGLIFSLGILAGSIIAIVADYISSKHKQVTEAVEPL